MEYGLPTALEVNGKSYKIRSDYRPCLDICTAYQDPNLTDAEKMQVCVEILYEDVDSIPREDMREAIQKAFEFINAGQDTDGPKKPKLVDWEQDFNYIVAPINRVAGTEIRSLKYLHWWTFVSYYMEIGGDCAFANIVAIRDKLAKGKKLDKSEQRLLRENPGMIHFKNKYSDEEKQLLKQWSGGNAGKDS